MVYFWREKNADKCAEKWKIVKPTREELGKELILKVEQKLSRIDVVFNKTARLEYYTTDKKPKKSLEGLSEKQIINLLGTRVSVDFAQLYFDFCDFYGFEKQEVKNEFENLNVSDLKIEVGEIISDLKNGKDLVFSVQKLLMTAKQIANLCGATWKDVCFLREQKEEEEGSFFKGKYVFWDAE